MARWTAALGQALVLVLALAACGEAGETASADPTAGEGLRVVATTSILGDLATAVVGDAGEVETLLPIGADPHGFAPSAAQAASLREADLVVANGLDLEEGLVSALESAESDGVAIFSATDHVDLLDAEEGHADDEHADDEHADEEHSEDEHADEEHSEDEHGHEGEDPHIWFDPARMADVVDALGHELADLRPDAGFADRADELSAELIALDQEIADMVAEIPEEGRILVTTHEVLGYFADAYDFEVATTIIPGGSTLAEPSAADLEDVIALVSDSGVPAILAETTTGSRLADVVAEEVGRDVTVVELFTESLSEPDGPAATYPDMMRTNATRIVEALTS